MSSKASGPKICVVIPAYNEAAVVGDVIHRVRERFPLVVVVDDGSPDETGAIARSAGAVVVTHLFNRGQGAALATGIEWALARDADVIVSFDADGQHRVEDIDALIAPIRESTCDVTLGSRFLGGGTGVPLTRRGVLHFGVTFTRLIARIAVTDTHNGLRAFSRRAASAIRIRQDRMAHASEILNEIGRLGLRFKEVPVHVSYTTYSQRKGQRSLSALRIVWDLFVR